MISKELLTIAYLGSGMLFILSLSGLSNQTTARRGNFLGAVGMVLAIAATIAGSAVSNLGMMGVGLLSGGLLGLLLARRVAMTAMPEMVAILHSFVGLAAVLVGVGTFFHPESHLQGSHLTIHLLEIFLGVFIGGITFIGSIVAWGKLRGSLSSKSLLIPGRHWINIVMLIVVVFLCITFIKYPESGKVPLFACIFFSSLLGCHLVMAIGGADMPVVVSMLNSYSGWAAASSGFMLSNDLLIVTGALVGSSGAILSHIMCKAMNRSFLSVILGGFGSQEVSKKNAPSNPKGSILSMDASDAAALLQESQSIVFIPGYGMAVAQAQYAIRELTEVLQKRKKVVRFAIHPVAGRLPGHMNVLLAEANIPYDIVFEMDDFNADLPNIDVVVVVGANDIVNPGALEDPSSPIYGMPVLEAWKAGTVVMLKRSMAVGYAGVDNPICYKGNTRMLFGDAKKSIEAILKSIK